MYTPHATRYTGGMKYRRCGNSGILLPEISLGLWHNFGGINTFENSIAIVEAAFDQGITHFDLANNYGPPFGSAEETFGQIMKKSLAPHRDELFISSKAGHDMWAGPYGSAGSRKHLMNSLDQSLKRMHLDYVDIFYSHCFDPHTPLQETLQTLVDMVRQGKTLYVGISKYPIEAAEFAFQYLKDRDIPCLLYQGRYSILTKEPETDIFPLIAKQQSGFIAFSPLAQGLLTDRYLNGVPKDSRMSQNQFLKEDRLTPELLSRLNQLNKIAKERGQTLAEMALAWTLKSDNVSSVIIGASTVNQLNTNIKSIQNTHFTQDELNLIN